MTSGTHQVELVTHRLLIDYKSSYLVPQLVGSPPSFNTAEVFPSRTEVL